MDVVLALAVGLGGLYGVLTAAAGAAQLRSNEIPPWDAILTVLGGLFVLASVALLTIDVKVFRYVLVAALTLVHVLAVNNGMQLHGRINLQHHVARFGVSVLIAGLAFWAAR